MKVGAQRLTQRLQVALGHRQARMVADSLTQIACPAEPIVGLGVFVGDEMPGALFVEPPRPAEIVRELFGGANGDPQRAQQLDPAPEQREQHRERAHEPQGFLPTSFAIESLHEITENADLVADRRWIAASFGDLGEETRDTFDLAGHVRSVLRDTLQDGSAGPLRVAFSTGLRERLRKRTQVVRATGGHDRLRERRRHLPAAGGHDRRPDPIAEHECVAAERDFAPNQ